MHDTIEEAYNTFYKDFVKISSRLVGGNMDAGQDIAQETFARALQYSASFDAERGSIRKWLNSILFRCVKDYQRDDRNGGMVTEVRDDDATLDSDFGEDNKTVEEVWAEVDKLIGDNRQICYLYFIKRYKPREIVEVTGFKNNSVRTAVKRFNNYLKDKYNE